MKKGDKKGAGRLTSPAVLVPLFVAVMLVPNMVLAVTEPFTFTTILASLLLPAGFWLLWAMLTRRPGIMVLLAIPGMILCAFQLVISYLYGNSVIGIDMFLNVMTTSVSEAGELLGSIYPSVIFVVVLYVPVIVLACLSLREGRRTGRAARRRGVVIAAGLLLAGTLAGAVSKSRNPGFAVRYHIFPANICYNMKEAVVRWNEQARYPQMSEGFAFGATRSAADTSRREIYVYVIGEASRACSWGLYGYERETTPRLSSRGDIVPLRDVLTQSNTTHKSVPLMLSPESAATYDSMYVRKSLPALFSEAGFRTAFISNQPANRSLTDFFSAQADTLVDVTPHNSLVGGHHYDEELIPHLRSVIEGSRENMLIILHTYGSHADHYKRYPPEFVRFAPDRAPSVSRKHKDKVRNAYDNTVVYTDHVLSEIISVLESTDACTAMLYCADHGEDILDDRRNRYLHASPRPTYYQLHVAAFLWFSDAYSEIFPAKADAARQNAGMPLSTSAMFHTLADMASIESRYAAPANSILNAAMERRPRLYVDDYNRALDVAATGLKEEDFTLMHQHGIALERDGAEQEKF